MFSRMIGVVGIFALGCLALVAWAAEDAKPAGDDGAAVPVATIGEKEVVTKSELDRAIVAINQGRMAMMRQAGQAPGGPGVPNMNHEQKLRLLDTLIDSRIEIMMTKEAGTKVTDEAVNAEIDAMKAKMPQGTDFAAFLKMRGMTEQEVFDRTKQRLEVRAFENEKTKDVVVTDAEIQEQFDKLKERGVTDDFDVQHILIKATPKDEASLAAAKTKIDAIHERLKKGEDFAAVAKETTEDTGSKETGGEYKGVKRGQMVPEFDKRMAEAKVGEVSEPFTSQYGWHILRVNRRGGGELTPELKDRLQKQMLMKKQKDEVRKLVQEKRATLNVTITLPAEAPAPAPTPAPAPAPGAAPAPGGTDAPKKDLDSLVDAAS